MQRLISYSRKVVRAGVHGGLALLLCTLSLSQLAVQAVAADAPACTVSAKLVNSCRPWFGGTSSSYPEVASDKLTQMQYYEQRVGRQMEVAHTYHNATDSALNATDMYYATRNNTYLYTNWKVADVWADASGTNTTVNSRIDSMASSIKSLGTKKIFLTIMHEPENDLTSDANCPTVKYVGKAGTPTDYRAMWANVEARFKAAGVTNVVWVMNYMGYPSWNCVVQDVYPGDSLVDWITFDPYQSTDTDVSFTNRVNNLYSILAANSNSDHNYLSKPWGLAEWGIHNSSQASAYQFYSQAQAAVDNKTFPQLKMYMIYDEGDPNSGDMSFRVGYDKTGAYDPAEQAAYNGFANDSNLTGSYTYVGDDVTPPVARIDQPIDGTLVSGPITVSGYSTDELALGSTSLLVDGIFVASVGSQSDVSFSWDSSSVADGQHTVQLRATDVNGNSGVSGSVTVTTQNAADTTAPSVPIGLTGQINSAGTVDLGWSGSTDDRAVTGYQIYKDGTVLASVGSDTTTYTDPAVVDPATSHSYTVTAQDLAGNSSAASTAVAVVAPPSQVTGLTATAVSGTAISLAWSPVSGTAVGGYNVLRNGVMIASVAAGTTSYQDSGLANTTSYSYQVTAYDTSGHSGPASAASSATTPDSTAPTAPTSFKATAGKKQVVLTWAAATDNVGVTGYKLYRGTTLLGDISGTSYTDGGLTDATSYGYSIVAHDAAGNMSTSATASAVTLDSTAPTAPSKLTAVLSVTTVKLSWTKSTDAVGVRYYTVYRGGVAVTTTTATTYTDATAPQGKAAVYTVSASDAAGNVSPVSNSVSVAIPDKTAPTAPTGLTATAGSKTVSLTWKGSTDNVGVKGYYVYRGTTRIATLAATATSYTNTGLSSNTSYTYKLYAFDAAGNQSNASTSVTAKAR